MKLLSFDIESPDGQFNEGNICEFGYILSDENFNIVEDGDILIKPILPLTRLNRRVNFAYTATEYNCAPSFTNQSQKIVSLLNTEDVLVIGHAVHNDVYCLRNAFIANAIDMPSYKFLDTQILFSIFKDEKTVFGLDKIAELIGAEDFRHHRADQDALLSLKTLEHICDQLNWSIEELVKNYGVTLGEASIKGVNNCSSIYFVGCAPSIDSKSSKKKLLAHFLENLSIGIVDLNTVHPLLNKKIAIDNNLELEDLNMTRRVIQRIVNIGAKYIRFTTTCDIFVSNNLQEDSKLAKKTISLADLIEQIGVLPHVEFDDEETLKTIKDKRAKEVRARSWTF